MPAHTIDPKYIEQNDNAVYRILRVNHLQEAMDILIPLEPPQNNLEYNQALDFFKQAILNWQPNIGKPNLSIQKRFQLANVLVPPLILLGHHARAAILNFAIDNIDGGLSYILSMQQTACLLLGDDVLLSTTKLGFAIASLAIPRKDKAKQLYKIATACTMALMDKTCTDGHSEDVTNLCSRFYLLIADIALLASTGADSREDVNARSMFRLRITTNASEIESVTNSRLKISHWITETLTENNLIYDFSEEEIKMSPKELNVFLCHSSSDKPVVRKIYSQLKEIRNVKPWFDEADILPGEDWDIAIKRAVRNSQVVIICMSKSSVKKEGFVQKEIRIAIDIALEKPENTIFIIPLKLEECDVPDRLSSFQWVKYPEGWDKLVVSVKKRAKDFDIDIA